MKTRSPDNPDENQSSDDSSAGLEACAKSLIQGMKMENPKQVAEALKSLVDIINSAPSESVEPHSYDAQKDE